MHAHRMFHSTSFLASLELLPTDPRFPNPAVLHAMCAVGSLYTATPTQLLSEPLDTPCRPSHNLGDMRSAHCFCFLRR